MKASKTPLICLLVGAAIIGLTLGAAQLQPFNIDAVSPPNAPTGSAPVTTNGGKFIPEVEAVLSKVPPENRKKIEEDELFRSSLKGLKPKWQEALALSWADGLKDNFCRAFLKSIAQQVYDLDGLKRLDLPAAQAACPQGKSLEDTINYINLRLMATFDDPYDHVRPPKLAKALAEEMSGTQKLSGRTGLVFSLETSAEEEDKPGGGDKGAAKFTGLIYHVARSGPAAKAGLLDGDYVIKIDDQDVIGTDAKHILTDVLPGAPGTSVKLTVKRGEQVFERTIVRGEFTTDAVWIRDLGDGIYAIVVSEWRENVHNEIYNALIQLCGAGARGIILDLRHNGGGLWDEAVETASYLVNNGTLVSIRKRVEDPHETEPHFATQIWERRNGQLWIVSKDEQSGQTNERHITATLQTRTADGEVKYSKQDLPFIENLPRMVVLGDHFSASASEVVIGALSKNHDEDSRRNQGATFRGASSYGKGIAQNVAPAPLGTAVSVTTGRYFLPDGTWVGDAYKHRNPIKPEKIVEQAPGALLYTPSDTQLNESVEYLKQPQQQQPQQ